MTRTDTQLKQTLANMLPDYSHAMISVDDETVTHHIYKPDGTEVLDTELLHLCREIRKGFTTEQKVKYLNTMRETIGGKVVSDFDIADAAWDKQTIALAKVKGIEIV